MVITLLALIDPVRGEATVHGLDKHPQDNSWRTNHLQKKFLESFALLCSTSDKGSKTASAVCMEQDGHTGTTLRVARNCGMPMDLITSLQDVLSDLTTIANQGIVLQEQVL